MAALALNTFTTEETQMPDVSTSIPQGKTLPNPIHDDDLKFAKDFPAGMDFARIIGAKLTKEDLEDQQSVGSCTTKSGSSETCGDSSVSPTPSSIFPTDVSTMDSPMPPNLYPDDVSAFASPEAPSIYPREVTSLTSSQKDASALAAPKLPRVHPGSMDDDSDSDSDIGTLSGSENGLYSSRCNSDDEEDNAPRRKFPQFFVPAPRKAPWKSWTRRSQKPDSEDESDEAKEELTPQQHQERWRIAGSRLAAIFQDDDSDSEAGEPQMQAKPQQLTKAALEEQDQRWRIAGKRLASIFQDDSDSEDGPSGILRH